MDGKKVRGGKGRAKLTGTHVPFIALWDGKIASGSVNENLLDFTDVLPTLVDVAESRLPISSFTDGISFYEQLLGKKKAKKREHVFCYYDPKWGNVQKSVWIHDHEWKLYETGEFYNIKQDPDEKQPIATVNLTKEGQQAMKKLSGKMMDYLR